MSAGDCSDNKLQMLVDRLLDERMANEDVAAIEAILRQDPSARDLLLESCQFHVLLNFEQHAELVVDRLVAAKLQLLEKCQRTERVVAAPSPLRRAWSRLSRANLAALIAAVAAMLLTAIVPIAVRPKPLRYAAMPPKISHPQVSGLKIESGSAQLELADIGSITVQGPADFELTGPKRARLNYGRIEVAASRLGERGFVVDMPNGEVTDLGTEFGIDVPKNGQNSLVVFDGAVDLRVPGASPNFEDARVERLVEGDGVVVNQAGHVDRIMTIFTGRDATFTHLASGSADGVVPLIVDVRDNLRSAETKKFYEIVPQGLGEDSRAYVDRQVCEWNGLDERGMPPYLVGADYVKPFNNDKMRRTFQMRVKLSRPARLFVFFDDRIPAPAWLTALFHDTGDKIGMDMENIDSSDGRQAFKRVRGYGPGKEVDYSFSVWERVLEKPATVTLGPNSGISTHTGMYGIAAVELDPKNRQQSPVTFTPTYREWPFLIAQRVENR